MSASIDIDEIDDIELMSELMKSRGLSSRGLQTLDQMKQRAKRALTISEKVIYGCVLIQTQVALTLPYCH